MFYFYIYIFKCALLRLQVSFCRAILMSSTSNSARKYVYFQKQLPKPNDKNISLLLQFLRV